ncbi:uncharacterized protein LOC118559310 [Fundulus heteroclitus]|uniref:uncharacterized protein LOC118559310 n=1 Tax=Fundulus heteroclitus TaxID=8078 RepID=UPI00165CA6A4|nr:uncharacterized protein LOC118559310 [Fundulus heteroclitus]
MMLIYLLITVLGTSALAKGPTECNLTNPSEDQHCFGALVEPLFFYLLTSEKEKILLKRNEATVFKSDSNAKHKNNYEYFNNGTLKVDKTTKNDSEIYQLEVYSSSSGILQRKIKLRLYIIAPVSQPAVSQTCLSPQQMSVNCSAKGDDVEFTLALDENLLIQTKVEHGENQSVSNVILTLHGQLEGNLVCKVWNKVSSEQTDIHLISCKDTSDVTVAVTAVICVLLLLLALFLGFKAFIKRRSRASLREVSADVVYADVRVRRTAFK